jgi:hypothetical protein
MSVSSATTLAHKHTHHHAHTRGGRRKSSHLHRTASHVGVTASALALTTTEAPKLERGDSGASRASDDVSVTSAPARLNKGKRPTVGVRRKSQVHLVDHSVSRLSDVGIALTGRRNARRETREAIPTCPASG